MNLFVFILESQRKKIKANSKLKINQNHLLVVYSHIKRRLLRSNNNLPASFLDWAGENKLGNGKPASPGTGTFSRPRLMIALVPSAKVRQPSSLFKAILIYNVK